MEKPRIGYVVKRFPRASETFIAQEILELEQRGAEVTVFSLWANDKPATHAWLRQLRAEVVPCGGVPLSEAWKWLHRRAQALGERRNGIESALSLAFRYPCRKGRHRLAEAVGVARAAEERGIQHLHAHFANDPAFVALLTHLALGIPFSFTAHAKDIYAKPPSPEMLCRQVEESSFAVTVTDANLEYLRGQLPPRVGTKVHRLYNGVDLDFIRPREGRSAARDIRLICIARLVEKKGVDTLLRAMALLSRRSSPCRLTVVGDGPQAQALSELRAELGVESGVEFLGGMSHEDAIAELSDSDIFVLPCKVASDGDRDALPTVLLEAMAAGLPCVSTRVGGVAEIIEHRRTGLLAPGTSEWALADALAELVAAPQVRKAMAEAGRRRAEALFDRRRNVASLLSRFEDSIAGREAPSRPKVVQLAAAGS